MNILTVTILNGVDTSEEVLIPEGEVLCAISANSDGFDGANVGYQIQFDNTNWLTVNQLDSTTPHTTALGATKGYTPVNSNVFLASHRGYKTKLRLKAATAQTGAHSINLHFRDIR